MLKKKNDDAPRRNRRHSDSLKALSEFTVIDTHVHFWDPAKTPRAVTPLVRALGFSPWLVDKAARLVFPRDAQHFFGRSEYIIRPYLAKEYLEDTAPYPVAGLVHVEAGWVCKHPLDAVKETRWLESIRQETALPLEAIITQADLSIGGGVNEVLRRHLEASSRVKGIRQMLSWHPDKAVLNGCEDPGLMKRPKWQEGFEQLAKQALSFETACYHHQIDDLAALARSFPETTITLCHLGTPPGVGGPFGGQGTSASERQDILKRWKEALLNLAQHPNAYIKLSGLGMPILGFGYENSAEEPAAEEIAASYAPLVNFAIDTFGAERCMFGSNFPIDKVSLSYSTLFEAYVRILSDRSAEEIKYLFGETAKKVYKT